MSNRKRASVVQRSTLLNTPLPSATKTYTVISHGAIINTALKLFGEKGFEVVNEKYKCNNTAQVAQGELTIKYGDDPDMQMAFIFANSYDKSMRFKSAIGGHVLVNQTSVIGEMMSWSRKHTGTADIEAANAIEKQIENAELYFKELVSNKDAMKHITLSVKQFAELLGVLYIEQGLLTTEQIAIVRHEFKKPSVKYNTPGDSLWTLYNHILIALSKSHPRTWMDQQKLVHFHLVDVFNLSEFDNETNPLLPVETLIEADAAELDVEPTNQLNLVEQITAVEEAGLKNIADATPEVEKIITQKSFVLPGYKPVVEPVQSEVKTEVPAEPAIEMEPEMVETPIEEISETGIVISKADVLQLHPEAEVGSHILLGDDSFEIIHEDETNFFIAASDFVVEKESAPAPVSKESEIDTVRISQEDILNMEPDAGLGTMIEIEGYVLQIIDVDDDQFVLKQVEVESVINTPTTEAETIEETTLSETELMDIEEDEEWELNNMVPIQKPTEDEEEPALDDDTVQTIISQELYDLYGSLQEFKYELVNEQYNVTLKTGEVVVLLKQEIDNRKKALHEYNNKFG